MAEHFKFVPPPMQVRITFPEPPPSTVFPTGTAPTNPGAVISHAGGASRSGVLLIAFSHVIVAALCIVATAGCGPSAS